MKEEVITQVHIQTNPSNVSQNEKKPRKAKKLPVAITEEEFSKLIDSTKKKSHKVAFLLGFGSGLRVSEVLNVKGSDVDLQAKTILVREGKNKKDRVVPLPKGFREMFIPLLPIGVTPRALQMAFRKSCKKAGLLSVKPNLHFHSLRHGFASHLASKGMPIHHIRTLMGHSNISTTNVYLEMNPTDAIKSYEVNF